MDHYVLAFIFSHDYRTVLLMKKQRPDWQKGHYNGVGGHIEKDETPFPAIRREIKEELGREYAPADITHAVTFVCPGGTVWVYEVQVGRFDDLMDIKSKTDESVSVFRVGDIGNSPDMLNSMRWLIPLVLSDVQRPILLNRLKKSV